jgi:hypothetical protein
MNKTLKRDTDGQKGSRVSIAAKKRKRRREETKFIKVSNTQTQHTTHNTTIHPIL